jgi:hypothetical protein
MADPPPNSSLEPNFTLRVAFKQEDSPHTYWWPGYPGYHGPGLSPDSNGASIDMNELPGVDLAAGHDGIWSWRIVDEHRNFQFDTNEMADEWNVVEGRMSKPCKFHLIAHATETKSLDIPGDEKKTDNPTQPFPGAGPKYSYSALEPCGGKTLTASVDEPTETFRYSTNVPHGVIMELREDGSNEWKQYSQAHTGLMPHGENLGVKVNAYELAKAENEADWQWRIRDPYDSGAAGNACSFRILREIQTSAPPRTNGQPQVQSEPKLSSNTLSVSAPEGYKVQASYNGNCANRPAGTVCLAFSDGYVWLVSDSIQSQTDRGSWEGKTIRVATGAKAFYFHVLGTSFVRELKR